MDMIHIWYGAGVWRDQFKSTKSQPSQFATEETNLAAWWRGVRAIVFSPDYGPFIVIPVAWAIAWFLQIRAPALEFQPSIYLVFLPAGVRTVAVFVYGIRGALIAAGSGLITTTYLIDLHGGAMPPALTTAMYAVFPALFSWVTMVAVCRWAKIPKSLSGLTLNHIAAIVLTQGLVVVTVKQGIFHEVDLAGLYGGVSLPEALTRWGAMFLGDVLGSLVGIMGLMAGYAIISAIRLTRR